MISFGPMSITLLVGALYGALFALMLAFAHINALANRFLALLMLAFVLRLVPYIIGYAGYYDAYPWLSFLPYNVSLAFGPLLYFYVRSLAKPALPRAWWYHFLPVGVQFAYYCVVFVQPLAFKNAWDGDAHFPIIFPIELCLTFFSLAAYWWMSLRHYRGYQRWMAANVSQLEENRLPWVRNFLLALALTVVLWIGFVGFDRLVAKLNYFHQFPFYVWLVLLVYYLGTEGYRHASHRYPPWRDEPVDTEAAAPVAAPLTNTTPVKREIDWQARGIRWRDQLVQEQWWRDPELSLATLARKLGTNTSDLSRAINEGLGMNFNELINRLRVDSVKAALREAREANLLDTALAAGFSSKASFNRCFKLYVGETPTDWRHRELG